MGEVRAVREDDRRSAGTSRLYGGSAVPKGHRLPRTQSLAALAGAMWVGTFLGREVPRLAGMQMVMLLLCVVAVVVSPRIFTAVVCAVLVGVAGGATAWHATSVPDSAPCNGMAVVRSDPRVRFGATSLILEIDGVRWRVSARGRVAGALSRVMAGETVRVEATCEAGTGVWADRDRIRHVVGRAKVRAVSETSGAGGGLARASNRVRRALVDGIAGVPENLRGLFTGLAVGDDRAQPQEMIDDFRASGISHLTAVSGQNVAYLIAMFSPLLTRLGRWWRLAAVLSLIVWFTVLTRAEPSVVRAAVMAGLVAISGAIGAGLNARTVLSGTVMVLLVVDPMLAWSVGFSLSVGATAGLAWWSAPISAVLGRRFPGAMVLSSTLAAQAGTAPVLLMVFGGIPVSTLVANPLVIGIAGFVMTVGVPLAVLASFVPWCVPLVAGLLTPALWWIAFVARVCAESGPTGWWNLLAWCAVLAWYLRRALRRRTTLPCGKVETWPHG